MTLKYYLLVLLLFISCPHSLYSINIISAQHNAAIIQTSDSSLITAGTINIAGTNQIFVAKYTTTGSIDTTFGTNGYTTLSIGTNAQATGIGLEAGGKIIVVGWAVISENTNVVIARFTSGGILDATYGPNSGYNAITGGSSAQANGVKIDTSGNSVVVGTVIANGKSRLVVARFNSSGNLDTSNFGSPNGYVTLLNQLGVAANTIALQSDGKIVVGGQVNTDTNNVFGVARFNTDGSLDSSFNSTGFVKTTFGSNASVQSLALQSDDKIVAAGYSDNQIALARYNTDGTLDTSFESDGKVTTTVNMVDRANAVGLDSGGNIIITGTSDANAIIVRYLTNGSLDTSFNSTGIVLASIGNPTESNALVIQSNDKIVIAGLSKSDPAIARYNMNGSISKNFSNGGFVIQPSATKPFDPHGHVFVYDTTTQTVTTANTLQDVTFNTNIELDGWSHSSGAATFTCTIAGKYLVQYDLEVTDTAITPASNTFSSLGVLQQIGSGAFSEIAGSQATVTMGAVASQVFLLGRSFIFTAQENDVLKIQFTGSTNSTNRIVAGGGIGTTKPSATLTMARVLK